jgi:hypothetical protein
MPHKCKTILQWKTYDPKVMADKENALVNNKAAHLSILVNNLTHNL